MIGSHTPLMSPPSCQNRRWFSFILSAAALLLLANCTGFYYYGPAGMTGQTQYLEGYSPHDPRYSRQQVDTESWWRGESAAGSPSVVISLSQQKAFFYKGGKLVGMSILSTGDAQHHTPTGHYEVQQKDRWHQSSQYGDYVDASGNPIERNIDRNVDPMPRGAKFDGANMFFFMRISGGVGMHAGYLPGYPASHGCIRMPEEMAENFYHNVEIGTPVTVKY
jgi:lipoprotein-anchoring transpeptidase ErfK/SrfK